MVYSFFDSRRTGFCSTQPRADAPDRFIGLAQAKESLRVAIIEHGIKTAALVEEGKHAWVIRDAMQQLGIEEVGGGESDAHPDAAIVGTMSPGPMLDAAERRAALSIDKSLPTVVPWRVIGDQLRSRPSEVLTGGRIPA